MIQRLPDIQAADGDIRPKWFNSPVTFHKGSLSEIRAHIPTFERREFKLEHEESRVNPRLDTIVRLPFGKDKAVIPIGVVSKSYVLVHHTEVLEMVAKALDAAKIHQSQVTAQVTITEYGERMALSLFLPREYSFDPGDGHPIALRLECWNSVDGSTRFRALMGWFRFVCSNGLVVGVTRSDMLRRHVGYLHEEVKYIGAVLMWGLSKYTAEKEHLTKWHNTRIEPNRLAEWINDPLRELWGFKAATRAFHISRAGADVEITEQYNGKKPTTIAVREKMPVPGAPKQSRNLYDVSQVLAWLAKERRDVQEQLEWRAQIPELMDKLSK